MDDPPLADRSNGRSPRDRARRALAAAHRRLEGTWVDAFIKELKAVDVVGWTTIFGAELLWSVLPLLILLSSLASTRIDDDLSRHIGLNNQGSHILEGMFRNTPSHAIVPIVTGLLFAFAGRLRSSAPSKCSMSDRSNRSSVGSVIFPAAWSGWLSWLRSCSLRQSSLDPYDKRSGPSFRTSRNLWKRRCSSGVTGPR
jgi:hypothetical protein